MKTLRLDARDSRDVERAADMLRQGRLVAFPTETVYGLGARGLDTSCIRKIFDAKGRPTQNPLIVHVASFEAAIPLWNRATPEDARILDACSALARRFWPGPLTLVARRSGLVPPEVTAGLDSVAVRCPDHAVARRVLELVREPIAAPSANASGRVSPTTAEHVLESLDGKIDAVLDAGACRLGLESTVLDMTQSHPVILRAGSLDEGGLSDALPGLTFRAPGAVAGGPLASPGLLEKHYAPRIERRQLASIADLTVAWTSNAAILVRAATHARMRSTLGDRRPTSPHEILADDPVNFARELYAALYRLERAVPEDLYIEAPPPEPAAAWRAVLDRLTRATV